MKKRNFILLFIIIIISSTYVGCGVTNISKDVFYGKTAIDVFEETRIIYNLGIKYACDLSQILDSKVENYEKPTEDNDYFSIDFEDDVNVKFNMDYLGYQKIKYSMELTSNDGTISDKQVKNIINKCFEFSADEDLDTFYKKLYDSYISRENLDISYSPNDNVLVSGDINVSTKDGKTIININVLHDANLY